MVAAPVRLLCVTRRFLHISVQRRQSCGSPPTLGIPCMPVAARDHRDAESTRGFWLDLTQDPRRPGRAL